MAEATDVTSVYEFVHFHFLYINYKMSLFKMSSHVGNLNSGGLYRWLYDYQIIFSHYCQPSILPTILFV